MERFKTQFMMSGVPTNVTVEVAEDNTFLCTLNLTDSFDGGEIPADGHDPDLILRQGEQGWEVLESRISLGNADVQNLGRSIFEDHIKK
jgi:hypothetical protein